jgi:hypothetical protein
MFQRAVSVNVVCVSCLVFGLLLPPSTANAADMVIPLATGDVSIPSSISVPVEYTFSVPAGGIPSGSQCRLELQARLDYPSYSGHTYPMWIRVRNASHYYGNTQLKDLLNKEPDFEQAGGRECSWMFGGSWGLLWTPDFVAPLPPAAAAYQVTDAAFHPYQFFIDLTPYVSAGDNAVVIYNYQSIAGASPLIVREPRIVIGAPVSPPTASVTPAPDPSAPLTSFIANVPPTPSMKVELNTWGDIRVTMSGTQFVVVSRISNPVPAGAPSPSWSSTTSQGGWLAIADNQTRAATWNGDNCRIDRAVTRKGDHIEIDDTIRNQSGANRAAKIEHRVTWPSALPSPEIWTSGTKLNSYAPYRWAHSPGNPTTIAACSNPPLAIGLVAEDDIFRTHAFNFGDKTNSSATLFGLADNDLVLPPGDTSANWKTLEWSIYPSQTDDYWSTINAIRRNFGGNFTIPGPIVFHSDDGSKSQAFYADWIQKRGIKWVSNGQPSFTPDEQAHHYAQKPYSTRYAYGIAQNDATTWRANYGTWSRKMHAANSGIKTLSYFHGQISTYGGTFDTPPAYNDSKLLTASGTHVVYPIDAPMREYVATLSNLFGGETATLYQSLLSNPALGIDGLNHDEFAWSGTEDAFLDLPNNTGVPWDNCSGVIDSNGNIIMLKSKAMLLQQGWKAAFITHHNATGKVTILSGPPETRTIQAFQKPCYAETNNYEELNTMHLTSPLGYGNHEAATNDFVRARMVRKFLKRAGLLLVSQWPDDPVGQHFIPLMYPITPVELREGMVVGVERIITSRSGIFGWPDGANGTAYVFGPNGTVSTQFAPKKTSTNGLYRWAVRIPSDHFVVIVRN